MKICQTHWDKLKELLEKENLTQFIKQNANDAYDSAVKEIIGELTIPDPLMICNNMIWDRSMETFGLGIMHEDCPLCYANKNYPDLPDGEHTGDFWVRTLIPHVKREFIERGFLFEN